MNKIDTASSRYIRAAESAKFVRVALKRTFPSVKFSVKTRDNSVDVTWTDGPLCMNVAAITDKYAGKGFDGSIDMGFSHYHYLAADGTSIYAGTRGTQGSGGSVPEHWTDTATCFGDRKAEEFELVNFANYDDHQRRFSADAARLTAEAICQYRGIANRWAFTNTDYGYSTTEKDGDLHAHCKPAPEFGGAYMEQVITSVLSKVDLMGFDGSPSTFPTDAVMPQIIDQLSDYRYEDRRSPEDRPASAPTAAGVLVLDLNGPGQAVPVAGATPQKPAAPAPTQAPARDLIADFLKPELYHPFPVLTPGWRFANGHEVAKCFVKDWNVLGNMVGNRILAPIHDHDLKFHFEGEWDNAECPPLGYAIQIGKYFITPEVKRESVERLALYGIGIFETVTYGWRVQLEEYHHGSGYDDPGYTEMRDIGHFPNTFALACHLAQENLNGLLLCASEAYESILADSEMIK